MCAELGIENVKSGTYNSKCNGGVERMNRTIRSHISRLQLRDRDPSVIAKENLWSDYLDESVKSINLRLHDTMFIVPFHAFYELK
jgi:hypothetical protein